MHRYFEIFIILLKAWQPYTANILKENRLIQDLCHTNNITQLYNLLARQHVPTTYVNIRTNNNKTPEKVSFLFMYSFLWVSVMTNLISSSPMIHVVETGAQQRVHKMKAVKISLVVYTITRFILYINFSSEWIWNTAAAALVLIFNLKATLICWSMTFIVQWTCGQLIYGWL